MKKLKKILPIFSIALVIGVIYSFFHIDGREIKNADKLSGECLVTVIVSDEKRDENIEYNLETKQIEMLQNLLMENSYTKRLTSTIIGGVPDKRYTILADWNDNGKTNLYIIILGNEYIQFSNQFGSNYHKIKNVDFEKELISILEN